MQQPKPGSSKIDNAGEENSDGIICVADVQGGRVCVTLGVSSAEARRQNTTFLILFSELEATIPFGVVSRGRRLPVGDKEDNSIYTRSFSYLVFRRWKCRGRGVEALLRIHA